MGVAWFLQDRAALAGAAPAGALVRAFVPRDARLAGWWQSSGALCLQAAAEEADGGAARLCIRMRVLDGSPPPDVEGVRAGELRAVVHLPRGVAAAGCAVASRQVPVEYFEGVVGLVRMLVVVCPGATAAAEEDDAVRLRAPLCLSALWAAAALGRRAARSGAARGLRARWHRRLRLAALRGDPTEEVAHAFGAGEPCCICQGGPLNADFSVALLPCKHTIHADCYRSWVSAESYPVPGLLCPMCRQRVHKLGRPSSPQV